jgi:hypothetical protein
MVYDKRKLHRTCTEVVIRQQFAAAALKLSHDNKVGSSPSEPALHLHEMRLFDNR